MITPDGRTAYVTDNADALSATVTPIELATNKPGTPIQVSDRPVGIAITPDGKTLYVTNERDNVVTPIDVVTNKPGTPITTGGVKPFAIAITPTAWPPTRSTRLATRSPRSTWAPTRPEPRCRSVCGRWESRSLRNTGDARRTRCRPRMRSAGTRVC